MSTIDDLRAKVKRLQDQLSTAEKSLNAALIEAHPIQPGAVLLRRGKEALEYQVSRLSVRYGSVRMMARKKTKTGWHTTETAVYWDYEVKK